MILALLLGLPTLPAPHPAAASDGVAQTSADSAMGLPASSNPAAAPAPSFPDSARRSFLASPRRYAIVAAAGVMIAGLTDRAAAREAPEASGSVRRSLARVGERLGNPIVLGPALVTGWLVGRVSGSQAIEGSAVRIGGAAIGTGAIALGLKFAVGRQRPRQSPDDADDFRPFRGGTSFPSGHTTLAFSVAAALDQETSSWWVPWLAYPAAALTGWSRVNDREHWVSDVVGGAALGFWAGREFDLRAREGRIPLLRAWPVYRKHAHGLRVGVVTGW